MNPEHDIPIRRRPDGSIDIEFYARRAAHLHGKALREKPVRWAHRLGRALARLAAAMHMPRASVSPRRGR